jgi:hypothetical protein
MEASSADPLLRATFLCQHDLAFSALNAACRAVLWVCLLLFVLAASAANAVTYSAAPAEVISGQTVTIDLLFNTESLSNGNSIFGVLSTSGATNFDSFGLGADSSGDNPTFGGCSLFIDSEGFLQFACQPGVGVARRGATARHRGVRSPRTTTEARS